MGGRREFLLGAGSFAALGACAQNNPPASSAPAEARFAPAPGQTAVERMGKLRIEGPRVLDQHGRPAMLRGMSLFWSQWMPQFYNAECVRWLRDDWNVNVVRAAIPPFPNGFVQQPERELAKARAVIDAAIASGIYVIVDWHAHQAGTEACQRFFAEIAEAYGAQPNLIYEPWNEPLNTHTWARDIKPHHEAVIPVIRAHAPDNLIIAGSSTWSQDVEIAATDPLVGSNIGYTLHFYAGTHREPLREKAREAMRRGAALMVTEYGSTEATGDGPIDTAETQLWWDFMEEHHISYAQWSIADKDETSAALRPGANAQGGWTDDMITQSGLMARERFRQMNGAG